MDATRWVRRCALALVCLLPMAGPAAAVVIVPGGPTIEFQTEIVTMALSGGPFSMPLGSNYAYVPMGVEFSLSSQRLNPGPRSLGLTTAVGVDVLPLNGGGAIDPDALNGKTFAVTSYYDLYFDLALTEVPPVGALNGAGTSFLFLDVGPGRIQSEYAAVFDKDAPNFGLLPPSESDPYTGLFNLEIPLGADINGNGENDKIKFTLGTFSMADANRTFITLPDGTVLTTVDMGAVLEGGVMDLSQDPPFTIGLLNPTTELPDPNAFGGPTTGSSRLTDGQTQVPEPATLFGVGLGVLALSRYARRRFARA